ncbi:MAG: cytochrome P450 [Actinomycetota bacterium]|nr:cytochrome P450 [Actinomycetota bacterium]
MEAPNVPEGYDPFVPTPDPFTPQRTMAAECPVHKVPGRPAVMVTGMEHAIAVLRDIDAFSSRSPRPRPGDLGTSLIHLDGPEHARQRKLVNRAFTPRSVAGMRARIETIAHELVDGFCERGSSDLVQDFSGPLPFVVMGEALGIPVEDRDRFIHWADDAIAFTSHGEVAPTDAEFRAYILRQIEERRTDPRDDLISQIVHATEGDDRLSDAQLIAVVRLLIIAGIETTANHIASLVRMLLADRPLWDAVLADRSLVPNAVEEALRLDPPLNWTPRLAVDRTELAGCPIDGGSMVLVGLASANRDPAVHADPDRFDLYRPPPEGPAHLAFGNGVHYCLGAALARLEGDVALNVLLDRVPDLALDPHWTFEPRGPQMMRGCKTLDVNFAPAARRAGASV